MGPGGGAPPLPHCPPTPPPTWRPLARCRPPTTNQCLPPSFLLSLLQPSHTLRVPSAEHAVSLLTTSSGSRALQAGGSSLAAPVRQRRQQLQVQANTQKSNQTTKKRTSGPPGLPPINANNEGGGGGGGWDGFRMARNVGINAALFGIYCLLDSGGPGGIFNGGGGGGGGGGECTVQSARWQPPRPEPCPASCAASRSLQQPAQAFSASPSHPSLPPCAPSLPLAYQSCAGGGGGGGGGGDFSNIGNPGDPQLRVRELDGYESGDDAPTSRKPRGTKKSAGPSGSSSKSGSSSSGKAKHRTAPRQAKPVSGQGSRRTGSAGTRQA